MFGSNMNEGLLITEVILGFNNLLFDTVLRNWDIWGPLLLFHKHALEITDEDVDKAYYVLEHYCGTVDPTPDHITYMTDMFTDSFFLFGITKYIDDYHLKFSSRPVYQYINSHHNERNQFNVFVFPPLSPNLPGVSHADELFLQWSPFLFNDYELSSSDVMTSKHITRMWANFVKTGNPGGEWSPVEESNKMYLNLNTNPQMEHRDESFNERMEFWRSLTKF